MKRIRRDLPPSVGDPLPFVRQRMQDKNCKFKFWSVHPDIVLGIISSLKNTKSSEIDNIDSYVFKKSATGLHWVGT